MPPIYAPEELEEGLVFKQPDLLQRHALEEKLEIMRDIYRRLGCLNPHYPDPRPAYFERGFPEKMTEGHKRMLEANLDSEFANINVREQKDIVKSIPIHESREKAVDLEDAVKREGLTATFSERPFEEACGSYAGQRRIFWLRAGVADSLMKAMRAFDAIGIHLHIEDCYRPPEVQQGLFMRRLKWVAEHAPKDWPWQQVSIEAVSKTAGAPGRAGHMALAAVDVTLCNKLTGEQMDRGNEYPKGGASASIHWPYITWAQFHTRTLFEYGMKMAGLTLLPSEDWHVSQGDRFGRGFAKGENLAAIYGPVKSFSRTNGMVQPYYDPQEVDEYFLAKPEIMTIVDFLRDNLALNIPSTEKGLWDLLHRIRRKTPPNG